ncbi:hypothetical protein MKZ38_009937 [Zalerion maritima]|uniref:Uncharacterized protein n=1 Tax=Zalerion maritima TaxID=339359 RepID=A0AAD5WUU0_9PEZI|nr:hypothetical protein MKZ38_009937 [Zalerion maritima]
MPLQDRVVAEAKAVLANATKGYKDGEGFLSLEMVKKALSNSERERLQSQLRKLRNVTFVNGEALERYKHLIPGGIDDVETLSKDFETEIRLAMSSAFSVQPQGSSPIKPKAAAENDELQPTAPKRLAPRGNSPENMKHPRLAEAGSHLQTGRATPINVFRGQRNTHVRTETTANEEVKTVQKLGRYEGSEWITADEVTRKLESLPNSHPDIKKRMFEALAFRCTPVSINGDTRKTVFLNIIDTPIDFGRRIPLAFGRELRGMVWGRLLGARWDRESYLADFKSNPVCRSVRYAINNHRVSELNMYQLLAAFLVNEGTGLAGYGQELRGKNNNTLIDACREGPLLPGHEELIREFFEIESSLDLVDPDVRRWIDADIFPRNICYKDLTDDMILEVWDWELEQLPQHKRCIPERRADTPTRANSHPDRHRHVQGQSPPPLQSTSFLEKDRVQQQQQQAGPQASINTTRAISEAPMQLPHTNNQGVSCDTQQSDDASPTRQSLRRKKGRLPPRLSPPHSTTSRALAPAEPAATRGAAGNPSHASSSTSSTPATKSSSVFAFTLGQPRQPRHSGLDRKNVFDRSTVSERPRQQPPTANTKSTASRPRDTSYTSSPRSGTKPSEYYGKPPASYRRQ